MFSGGAKKVFRLPDSCLSNLVFNHFASYHQIDWIKRHHNMTRQWLTGPDEYVCTLSTETQEIAKRELREDENIRQQALSTMRNWIIKNPRIVNCRLDSKFLLRFLRFTKFHVPLAEEVLERYLLLRQAYSQAFHNADFKSSRMQALINRGIIVISPKKDKLGRRVVLARVAPFDPYEFKNEDILRIAAIFHETLMEDEDSQVRGYVYIGDGKGIGFPYLTLFTPKEAVRLVKNGEKTIPMRHKEAHGFNIPSSLKFAVDFGFSLISEKYKKRIKIHSSLEELHQHIDKSLLPEEYGGTIPFSEMLEYTKQELEKYRNVILSHDQMKVNMEFYNERAKEGAVSALKHGMLCKVDSGLTELCGNFRKLEGITGHDTYVYHKCTNYSLAQKDHPSKYKTNPMLLNMHDWFETDESTNPT